MVKSKFAVWLDSLMFSFIFFLLVFSWAYRLTRMRRLSYYVSILFAIIFFFLTLRLFFKKYRVSTLSANENKLLVSSLQKLKFSTEKYKSEYFESLLSAKKLTKNIFKNDNSYFYINISCKLSSYDFVVANNFYLETEKNLPLCFIADGLSDEFSQMIKESPIKYEVFSPVDLFEIMKQKSMYPEQIADEQNSNRQKFLKKAKNDIYKSLTKVRFKDFFFTGLSLVIISVIVPYSLYYLIFGSILLIMSFICLFVKHKNGEEEFQKSEKKLVDYCK